MPLFGGGCIKGCGTSWRTVATWERQAKKADDKTREPGSTRAAFNNPQVYKGRKLKGHEELLSLKRENSGKLTNRNKFSVF